MVGILQIQVLLSSLVQVLHIYTCLVRGSKLTPAVNILTAAVFDIWCHYFDSCSI